MNTVFLKIREQKYMQKSLLWFLIGSVIAISIASMYLSGSWNLGDYNELGEIYEFGGQEYDFLDERTLPLYGKDVKWEYFLIKAEGVNRDSVVLNMYFYNKKTKIVQAEEYPLQEGINILKLLPKKLSMIYLKFPEAPPAGFRIRAMQLREKLPVFSGTDYVKTSLAVFGGYAVVSLGLLWLLKKYKRHVDFYTPVKIFQALYLEVGNSCAKLSQRISAANRSRVRVIAFLTVIMYMIVIDTRRLYTKPQYFKYHMLLCAVCILSAALVTIPGKLRRVNWRHPLVLSWYALWMIACISDFVVEKYHMFVGYMMLLPVGFLFFVWNHLEDKTEVLRDLARAIEVSFLINLVFCVLFRPEVKNLRYAGSSHNPNIFGMYLAIASCIFLLKLDHGILQKVAASYMLWSVIAYILTLQLIIKTQSRTSFLGAVTGLLVFLFKNLILLKGKEYKIRFVKLGAALLILAVPTVFLLDWVLSNSFTAHAQASRIKEVITQNGFVQRILKINSFTDFISFRNVYFKRYIEIINLWGHEHMPLVRGQVGYSHNGLLAIVNRYGVFAGIPYLYMMFYTLYFSFRHMLANRSKAYGLMPMLVSGTAIVMLMMENVEQPFRFVSWIALYFIMGLFFGEKADG